MKAIIHEVKAKGTLSTHDWHGVPVPGSRVTFADQQPRVSSHTAQWLEDLLVTNATAMISDSDIECTVPISTDIAAHGSPSAQLVTPTSQDTWPLDSPASLPELRLNGAAPALVTKPVSPPPSPAAEEVRGASPSAAAITPESAAVAQLGKDRRACALQADRPGAGSPPDLNSHNNMHIAEQSSMVQHVPSLHFCSTPTHPAAASAAMTTPMQTVEAEQPNFDANAAVPRLYDRESWQTPERGRMDAQGRTDRVQIPLQACDEAILAKWSLAVAEYDSLSPSDQLQVAPLNGPAVVLSGLVATSHVASCMN